MCHSGIARLRASLETPRLNVRNMVSNTFDMLKTHTFGDSAPEYSATYAITFFFLCWVLILISRPTSCIPIHGSHWWFEPTFVLQTRFIHNARGIISSGYAKFKDKPFVVRRYDVDITVLPHKYLGELRLIPSSKLSGVRAQIDNLVHRWTHTTLMMESDLHFRVLQNKLTAELPKYLDMAIEEAEYGWALDVPQSEEWMEVDIQQMMRNLVARMTSRIFLGLPTCRDLEWLELAIKFPVDTFTTAFTLRRFPPWLHAVIAPLIPARYRLRNRMKKALDILSPTIAQYRREKVPGSDGEHISKGDTLLEWMIDHANEKELQPLEMSTRQCILTLASIHTTSMTVTNVILDLCAHPEWFPVLLDEIYVTTVELGILGAGTGVKEWLPRLEKLDSFIVECQRFNPPILLAPQRVAMVPLKLHDGTEIPKGSRISWAANDHLNDPCVTPDPSTFDPMRSYRKRHSELDQRNKHLAGQTDINNLTFGYGKLACPGRAFAVGEIKAMLVKLLSEFEFRYPEGKARPENMYVDENVFPDPSATIMMRKKTK
ncbi:cytochrome P450 [Daldinia caldariorum]|uniref:cytochrome P450 n=1 Tax=Daldinia caldariorum TaxID=326644 RepID=UPI002007CFAF|nr:cytochrome P450 [Daldinia caldariorum]KAI1470984.1 cytochrome P450 [Daldinia caldariorum]